jgi:FecR protein
MSMRRRIGSVALVLTLLGVACRPEQSWGQEEQRIGTVLAVEGTATVRVANATTPEPLQFRAAIFPNDTVRTAAASKVKILLRDDSIMTLAENSEMQFTEFFLTPQQRRTIVSLTLGKLRVVTTKIFGAGSVTEVRTANTVAGVRGTTFVVVFIPPEETDVVVLDGVVAVRNPNFPQLEPVSANFGTQVLGNAAPNPATEVPVSERQALELGLRLTEQIPVEVKPTIERQAIGPIRGEPSIVASGGPAGPAGPPLPSVALLPAGIQPGAPDPAAQLNQLVSHTAIVNTAQAAQPPNLQQQIITPDNKQTTTTIQQRQQPPPPLRITISFPR